MHVSVHLLFSDLSHHRHCSLQIYIIQCVNEKLWGFPSYNIMSSYQNSRHAKRIEKLFYAKLVMGTWICPFSRMYWVVPIMYRYNYSTIAIVIIAYTYGPY